MKGKVFGSLTVLRKNVSKSKRDRWICLCACGNTKIILGYNLRSGNSTACGCKRNGNPTHGMFGTSIYSSWAHMLQRCTNINDKDYHNYGGRGIKVCSTWFDFNNFYKDMGDKPSISLTLERINNEEGYNSDNCKWATRKEQANNKRNNIG